jgi:hypothetical protein
MAADDDTTRFEGWDQLPIEPGGLDLSRRDLHRESRSLHWQRVSLDSRENLDTFKKLVSTIEISRSKCNRDRDFSICRDVLFQTVEIEIEIKTSTKIEIYQYFRVMETVNTWILNCREYLDSRDMFFSNVEIEITLRQIETPRLNNVSV